MFIVDIILLICTLVGLYQIWETYQSLGGGFAVIKFLGLFLLLYSAMCFFLGLVPLTKIVGCCTLVPGLWLFFRF